MIITPKHKAILNAEVCPYCRSITKTITEQEVYGKTYRGNSIIACEQFPRCDSYVGTHSDGTPLGRLANKELRQAKKKAHEEFDKIWKDGHKKRGSAYAWLSDQLELPQEYTHIGMFSINTCKKVEVISKKFIDEK